MTAVKKVICFVLAIVLLVGVTAVGVSAAPAAFSDGAEIQYKTAVGVMSGMGIIAGRDDGRFDPGAELNRAEAAKLICYVLLGREAADSLKADSAPFPDVKTDAWYAPYVRYLTGVKVIAGFDDGNFYPSRPVTALQLSKMLLVAAGYGQNGEYEGENFAARSYLDAMDIGRKSIYDGTKATNFLAAVTREEAALYIYNAMCNIDQVEYKNGEYVSRNTKKGQGASLAYEMYNYDPYGYYTRRTAFEGWVAANSASNVSLAGDTKNYKPDDVRYYERTLIVSAENDWEAMDVLAASGLDLLGHKVTVHTNGKNGTTDEIVYYIEDEASVVASTTVKTIPSATFTRAELIRLGFSNSSDLKLGDDGKKISTFVIGESSKPVYTIGSVINGTGSKNTALLPGEFITVIANNSSGFADTIVKISGDRLLNRITSYTAPTAGAEGSVTFEAAVNGKTTYALPTAGSGNAAMTLYDGITAGDYVYVTFIYGSGNAPVVERAEVVSGVLSFKSSNKATINGETYDIGTASPQTVSGGEKLPSLLSMTDAEVSEKTVKFVFYSNGELAGWKK